MPFIIDDEGEDVLTMCWKTGYIQEAGEAASPGVQQLYLSGSNTHTVVQLRVTVPEPPKSWHRGLDCLINMTVLACPRFPLGLKHPVSYTGVGHAPGKL